MYCSLYTPESFIYQLGQNNIMNFQYQNKICVNFMLFYFIYHFFILKLEVSQLIGLNFQITIFAIVITF